MSEIGVIRVLNVLRHYKKLEDHMGNNITRNIVVFSIEGGTIDVDFDPTMDIPVGWSGRAVVSLNVRTVVYPPKKMGSKSFTATLFSAVKVLSFDKGFKHPDLNDIISSVKK